MPTTLDDPLGIETAQHDDPLGIEKDDPLGIEPAEQAPWSKLKQVGLKGIGGIAKGIGMMANAPGMAFTQMEGPMSDQDRAELKRRMERTPSQARSEMEQSTPYVAGQALEDVAPEVFPVTPAQERGKLTQLGGTVGGFVPLIASGPAAPVTMGLQSAGEHVSNDYEQAKAQGMDDDKAAEYALTKASQSGTLQASIFAILPAPLKSVLEKYLVAKLGKTAFMSWLTGRAAAFGHGATLGGTSAAGENIIEGRPITEGVGQSATALGTINALLPFRGPNSRYKPPGTTEPPPPPASPPPAPERPATPAAGAASPPVVPTQTLADQLVAEMTKNQIKKPVAEAPAPTVVPAVEPETPSLTPKEQSIKDRVAQGIDPQNIRVSIAKDPAVPGYGYVQVDENPSIEGHLTSTNPETLRKHGFDIPDSKTLMELPQGQYTLPEIRELLKPKEPPAPAPVAGKGQPAGEIRKPKDNGPGLTTEDGLLYEIVGNHGKVPAFLPGAKWERRYKQIMDWKRIGKPLTAGMKQWFSEQVPGLYEDHWGEAFKRAYAAAKEAGIAGELFQPIARAKGGKIIGLDQLLEGIKRNTQKDLSVDDLWNAIEGRSRERLDSPEARQDRFWQAIDNPANKSGLQRINQQDLKVGDTFRIRGPGISNEELTVAHLDQDTGMVYVKDGPKLRTQEIPDGAQIWVKKGSHVDNKGKLPPPTLREEPPLFGKPESIEEQKARESREAEAKRVQAQKDELAKRAAKPLVGSRGDIGQKDMFGGGDLLSEEPKRSPAEQQHLENLEREAKERGLIDKTTAETEAEPQAEKERYAAEEAQREREQENELLRREQLRAERRRKRYADREQPPEALTAEPADELPSSSTTAPSSELAETDRTIGESLVNQITALKAERDNLQRTLHGEVDTSGFVTGRFGAAKVGQLRYLEGQIDALQSLYDSWRNSMEGRKPVLQNHWADKTVGEIGLSAAHKVGEELRRRQQPKPKPYVIPEGQQMKLLEGKEPSAKLPKSTYFHGTREQLEGAFRPGLGKDPRRFLHEEGIWFAPNAGKDFDSSTVSDATRYSGDSGTIVEAKLEMKNPYYGDIDELVSNKINVKWLKDHGYDGFVDDKSGSGLVAVLDSSQIKEVGRKRVGAQALEKPVSAALRDNKTGEVWHGEPTHGQLHDKIPDMKKRTLEAGFMTDKGNFWTQEQTEAATGMSSGEELFTMSDRQRRAWKKAQAEVTKYSDEPSIGSGIKAALEKNQGEAGMVRIPSKEELIDAWGDLPDHLRNLAKGATNKWHKVVDRIKRGVEYDQISKLKDAAETMAHTMGNQTAKFVAHELNRAFGVLPRKVATERNALREMALTMVIEAEDRAKLGEFRYKLENAPLAAPIWRRKALKAIAFADEHWDKLKPVAETYKNITDAENAYENANGIPTLYRHGGYVFHTQDLNKSWMVASTGGGGEGISTPFRKMRDHATYADSIANGLIPHSLNAVDLLQKRISIGQKAVNLGDWISVMEKVEDHVTKLPLAVKPEWVERTGETPPSHPELEAPGTPPSKTTQGYYKVPPEYELQEFGGRTFGLHKGYTGLFSALTDTDFFQKSDAGRAFSQATSTAKHTMLLFDSYHLGRLAMWNAFSRGGLPTYRRGLTLLDNILPELQNMIARGEIPEKYGKQLIRDKADLDMLLREGMNVGTVGDNLHTEFLRKIPGLGDFNRLVFEKYQRGAMAEVGLIEMNRLRKAHPEMTDQQIARMAAKGVNTRFGNLQSQGWIKSKTGQQLARIIFLAPQWNESLIRAELGAFKEAGQAVGNLARGRRPALGLLARGVGTAVLGIFIGNQIINMATRGHPTWENEEEGFGAKISAFIPDAGGGPGFFLNPTAVPMEMSHLLMNNAEKHDWRFDQAMLDMAKSRFSPLSRGVWTFATGTTTMGQAVKPGERISTSLREATPVPISAGAAYRFGKQVVNRVRGETDNEQKYPGEFQKSLMQSAGIKTEQVPDSGRRIMDLAKRFERTKVIPESTTHEMPFYGELTAAIKRGNMTDANEALDKILTLAKGSGEPHTLEDVARFYEQYPRRNFTRNNVLEDQFYQSLTPAQKVVYNKAMADKAMVADKVGKLIGKRVPVK